MTTQHVSKLDSKQTLTDLLALSEFDRREVLLRQYQRLATTGEQFRSDEIQQMVAEEQRLDGEQLQMVTRSRLKAWVLLPQAQAQIIADQYETVMAGEKAGFAMRHVGVVQSLLSDFSASEQERLRELIPERVLGPLTRPMPATTIEPKDSLGNRLFQGFTRMVRGDASKGTLTSRPPA